MGTIRGFALDASIKKIAKDLIEMEESGIAVDINTTVQNWNNRHNLVKSGDIGALQNDIALFISVEKNRKLSSMSAIGYGSYLAEPYVEMAKKLMSPPSYPEPEAS